VVRTPSLTVITAVTVALAVTAAGCSGRRSHAASGQSVSPSALASTPLGSAPTTASLAGSAGSASVEPASPGSAVTSDTPVPSVTVPSVSAPPPTGAPTASASVPPLGTHAHTVVAGLSCPAAGSPGQPTSPSPRPLLPGVAIKAVVRCEDVQRSYPGLGSWTVQLAEIADSGLGPFLADLRVPSDPMPSGIMCPDFRILVPWFEVVDSAGAAINVAIPTNQCGAPKTAALTALQALHFRVTAAVRVGAVS
jgi:hypothetical protein